VRRIPLFEPKPRDSPIREDSQQPGVIELLRPAWPIAAILALAALTANFAPPLAPQYVGLRTLGPYAALVVAAAVSAWFNRERIFVLAISLLAAFAANDYFPDALTYAAFSTLVPLNALLAFAFVERGLRFGRAWRWVALLALEAVLVYVLQRSFDAQDDLMDNWLLRSPPTPLLGRLVFAVALAAALVRAWPSFTPIELGAAGALAAFFIACEWVEEPKVFATFVAAAAAILVVAVLQESYRLAFRDALTGLPNRRALEEQLRALEEPYTVAMVDVDHFKKFNDTHGHDIGDQVLKLVAARLAEVGGGGRAFRYGGEEFTVLFRDKRVSEALPHLEATRASVEMYKMTLRGTDRPKDREKGAKLRAATEFERTDQLLSVTVSIGAAEPGKRLKTQQEVVKGADDALYRAKERGRNQVSR
jgi:GGDEF domain-containing protein